MKVVEHEQGSNKWLAWRLNGVGASEVSALTNNSPYISGPNELYRLKKGINKSKDIAHQAKAHGEFAEETGRLAANEMLNTSFHPICVEDEKDPFFRVSLDGYCVNHGILECKAVTEKIYGNIEKYGVKGIPEHIQDQIQYQMLVMNDDRAVLYYQQNKTGNRSILKVPQDLERQKHIKELVLQFKELFLKDIEPDFGPNEYVDLFGSPMATDCELLIRVKEKVKSHEKELKVLKTRAEEISESILARSERGRVKFRNLRINKVTRKGAIDYDKLRSSHDIKDVESFRKPDSHYIKSSLVK